MADIGSDNYLEMLPMLLGDRDPAFVEPGVNQLSPSTRAQYRRQLDHRNALQKEGAIATGDDIVVFPTSVDSWGNPSSRERAENERAADQLVRTLGTMQVPNTVTVIPVAPFATVAEVVADPRVGHLVFIGHANRSVVSPTDRLARWDSFEGTGHLKRSVGVLGCATVDVLRPRFGAHIVADPEYGGVLYGKTHGSSVPSELGNLTPYQSLETVMPE